jgi:cation diffusion facilitator family transporter
MSDLQRDHDRDDRPNDSSGSPGEDLHDHHSHGPGNEHHHHRAGIVGWFQSLYLHSHDIHEKVDEAMETHERGIWAIKVSLLILGVTAIFQLVIFFFSRSTGLLADTIHNFGDAATSVPLWIAFAFMRRARSRQFTYGYGRVEDLAGLVIVVMIFFSACVSGFESIRKLISPEPISHLWWVSAAALVGFLGNEITAAFRIRVGQQIGSAALIADGQHSRVDGFTSLAVLFGALGVALGFPIVDPIVGLLITLAILYIVKDAATSVFRRMLDGIEPHILSRVEHAPTHVEGVRDVHQVRARWLGHKVYADLHITVDPDLTVAESHEIGDRVYEELAAHVPAFGDVTVHVCPAAHTRAKAT